MVKVVLKLGIHDDRIKRRAMKTVSGLPGVDSISVDVKEEKLTLIGDIDTITVVSKLRKICSTEIVSVGPVKEPEKKPEPKKPEPKKPEPEKQNMVLSMPQFRVAYHQYPYNNYRSVEEDPNACVIC